VKKILILILIIPIISFGQEISLFNSEGNAVAYNCIKNRICLIGLMSTLKSIINDYQHSDSYFLVVD